MWRFNSTSNLCQSIDWENKESKLLVQWSLNKPSTRNIKTNTNVNYLYKIKIDVLWIFILNKQKMTNIQCTGNGLFNITYQIYILLIVYNTNKWIKYGLWLNIVIDAICISCIYGHIIVEISMVILDKLFVHGHNWIIYNVTYAEL